MDIFFFRNESVSLNFTSKLHVEFSARDSISFPIEICVIFIKSDNMEISFYQFTYFLAFWFLCFDIALSKPSSSEESVKTPCNITSYYDLGRFKRASSKHGGGVVVSFEIERFLAYRVTYEYKVADCF